jgi:hypothetical protein
MECLDVASDHSPSGPCGLLSHIDTHEKSKWLCNKKLIFYDAKKRLPHPPRQQSTSAKTNE